MVSPVSLSSVIKQITCRNLYVVVCTREQADLPAALAQYDLLMETLAFYRQLNHVPNIDIDMTAPLDITPYVSVETVPISVVTAIGVVSHAIGRIFKTVTGYRDDGQTVNRYTPFLCDTMIRVSEEGFTLVRNREHACGVPLYIS